MAHLTKRIYKPTGRITWMVTFRKRKYDIDGLVKKDRTFSKSFLSKEEAEDFIYKNEAAILKRLKENT